MKAMIDICRMIREDALKAAFIEQEVFVHPWSEQSILGELLKEGSVFFMAFCQGEPVGYVGLSSVLDEGYMGNLAVKAQFRRTGVGKALMKALIKECENMKLSFVTLEVRESNLPAVRLYESLGFKAVGLRKGYYKEPLENAVLMTLYLN